MNSIQKIASLIFVVTLLGMVYSLFTPLFKIYDSVEYSSLANNLVNNSIYYAGDIGNDLDFRLFSKRTLGYPLFMAMQQSQLFLITAQVLLYFFSIMLGLVLLSHFTTSKKLFFLFLIFVVFSPVLLFHSQFILSDLLLTSLIMLGLVVYFEERISLQTKLKIIGILWAVALLVKPVMLPSLLLIPFVAGYLIVRKKTWQPAILLPVLVWISVSMFNQNQTSMFEYSCISTINLAHYNAKLAIASKYGNDSAQQFTSSPIFKTPRNTTEYNNYLQNLNQLATESIKQNIGAYLKIQVLGMIKMVLDPGRWELYTFFNQNTPDKSLTELLFSGQLLELKNQLGKTPMLLITFLILLIINLFKAVGIVFSIFKPPVKWWLLVGLCVYFLALTGPIGAARFMLPVTIITIIMSVIGWGVILNFLQKSPEC